MRVVQTVFFDNQRLEQRLVIRDDMPLLAFTGDRRLVIGWRKPSQRDWVNGVFVGDHEEPEDGDHVHGEPS